MQDDVAEGSAVTTVGGRYQLLEQTGQSGVAVVWRGLDDVLRRSVTVKVLAQPMPADAELARLLREEAPAAARLAHPNIVTMYDYGEEPAEDGLIIPFVVTESIYGSTLEEVLSAGRPVPWPAAAKVAGQAASALAAAHEAGLVHCDVTAANIMLTASGAKVADFGVAALLSDSRTPAFLAPEGLHAASAPATPAADVYGLGIVLYRLLAGSQPWQAMTPTGLLEAQLRFEPAPLPRAAGLPVEVTQICMECLAKDPDDRPPAAAVATILLAIHATATGELPAIADRPEAAIVMERRHAAGRNRRRAVAAAVITAGAVAGLTLLLPKPGLLAPAPFSAGPVGEPSATEQVSTPAVAPVPSAATSSPTSAAGTGPGNGAPTPLPPTTGAPAPVPTTPSPSPTPPPAAVIVQAIGGTVTVSCDDDTNAVVTSMTPADGFTTENAETGPAHEIRVVFLSPTHQSEIKATCTDGTVDPKTKETPINTAGPSPFSQR